MTALHRPTSEVEPLRSFGVALAEGDVLDPGALERALPGNTSDVFHVAGDTSLWSRANRRQSRINVHSTRNIAQVALRAEVGRFVYTSSVSAYGFGAGPLSEDMPKRGLDSWINYSRSKALAEQEVQKAMARGLKAVIINPAHIIGRYYRTNWARMIKMVHQHRLPGIPPGSGTFCHAEQVARAHIAAARKGRAGENYLLGGPHASFVEVVQEIGRLTGREVPGRQTPAWLLKILAHVQNAGAVFTGKEPDLTPEGVAIVSSDLHVDSSKAERELGYRAVPLRRMLEDAYNYLKEVGELEEKA